MTPSVRKRKREDSKRRELAVTDRDDGGGGLLLYWTKKLHPDVRWEMDQLGYAVDDLTAAIQKLLP